MLQMRRNVFETNSSNTHSLTICSKDEYQDWADGKCYWSRYGKKLVPKEEVERDFQEFLTQKPTSDSGYLFREWLYEEGLYSFEDFWDMGDYDTYEKSYISKSGDEIMIFGYYGYNG